MVPSVSPAEDDGCPLLAEEYKGTAAIVTEFLDFKNGGLFEFV